MATFLLRAVEHRLGRSLPEGESAFNDDDGTTHEANIDKAAAVGLTGGSSAGGYERTRVVLRDQMASFLTRSGPACRKRCPCSCAGGWAR